MIRLIYPLKYRTKITLGITPIEWNKLLNKVLWFRMIWNVIVGFQICRGWGIASWEYVSEFVFKLWIARIRNKLIDDLIHQGQFVIKIRIFGNIYNSWKEISYGLSCGVLGWRRWEMKSTYQKWKNFCVYRFWIGRKI